jgi:hypothetical protein
VPFHEISNAANRLNSLFSVRGIPVDRDEKKSLFERLATVMTDRISEATSTDLSRLAWLHLNLHDESEARRYTRLGLAKEINNSYCVSLAICLGISNI